MALISGAVAATALTMILVPILYWELRRRELAAPRMSETTNENADAGVQRLDSAADFVAA